MFHSALAAKDLSQAERATSRLLFAVSLGALTLLAATWQLWTPQTLFPRIPLIRAAIALPDAVEWIGGGLLVLTLAASVLLPSASRWRRRSLAFFAVVMTGMIVCDQQRLQTWAYQFAIMGTVLACVPAGRAVVLLRLFVISIYFHSALSKMSMGFLESAGPGQMLVLGLLKALPFQSLKHWTMLEQGLEVLLPLAELLVALLLLFPYSRWAGTWASLGMHLLLLLALGPLGLNHKPGVLLWNLYFMGQNVVLFGPLFRKKPAAAGIKTDDDSAKTTVAPVAAAASLSTPAQLTTPARLAMGIIAAAVLLPFLEPLDYYDVWPSWAVYAGSPEKLSLHVDAETYGRLPESLRRQTSSRRIEGWNRLLIDRWALDVLHAPIYPEVRSQLGVALSIARLANTEDGVRVFIYSRADRWTGERKFHILNSTAEIEQELNRYWLNGTPRDFEAPPSNSGEE